MKRVWGPLEEGLRREVEKRLESGERGARSRLAQQLGKPGSWVTEYVQRLRRANLDTSLELMRFVGWRVPDTLRKTADPIANVPRDEQQAALLRAWERIPPSRRVEALE